MTLTGAELLILCRVQLPDSRLPDQASSTPTGEGIGKIYSSVNFILPVFRPHEQKLAFSGGWDSLSHPGMKAGGDTTREDRC